MSTFCNFYFSVFGWTAGVAEIVRLLSTDLQEVQLGKPAVAFKLQFCDEFDNASHTFGDGTSKIKLSCTSAKLNIKGVKDFYKPNKEGIANGKIYYSFTRYVHPTSFCQNTVFLRL